jgi:hypothetical protein
MASSGKKKTTMAKLNRETKVRERRANKQHRRDARKQGAGVDADGNEQLPEDDGRFLVERPLPQA